MLPGEPGDVGEERIGNLDALVAEVLDGAAEMDRVPEMMAEATRFSPEARCLWFSKVRSRSP